MGGFFPVVLLGLLRLVFATRIGGYPESKLPVVPVQLAVSPFSALLACLAHEESPLTPGEREQVSSLIFNGVARTEVEGKHVRSSDSGAPARSSDSGARQYRDFLTLGEALLLAEAQSGRGPEVTAVFVEEEAEFLLEKDQVRKFFDAQFAWEYLTQIAVSDWPAFVQFDRNLDTLLNVLPDMYVDRAVQGQYGPWIADGDKTGADSKLERKNGVRKGVVERMEIMKKADDEENAEMREAQLLLDTLLEVGEQKDLLKKVVRKIGLAFTWMKE